MSLWTLPFLLLSIVQAHEHHQGAPEVFQVRVGHLVVLPCNPALAWGLNVTWSREGQDLDRADDVEVHDGQLWFTHVQPSHGGAYTCHYRSQSGKENWVKMELLVSTERCSSAADHRVLNLGETVWIPCQLQHVYKAFNLSGSENIRWTKDCASLLRPEVDRRGRLKLTRVTPDDAGTYSCFIDVSMRGRSYSASWSVEVEVINDTVYMQPHVVYPQDQEVRVHVGGSAELRCVADLGHNEDSHTMMFWFLNDTDFEEFPEVHHSWNIVSDRGRFLAVSTLTIAEVHRSLMNISITCWVQNTVGVAYGQLWLAPAVPSPLLAALAFSFSLSLVLLLLAALLYCCRVELVLLHRDLRRRFTKQYSAGDDEKLFDGVVSCVHAPGRTPPELSLFSLQLLPQRLEGEWGYRLYIQERDGCPGEAIHDALSETVKRSRRLLLLLCASEPQGAPSGPQGVPSGPQRAPSEPQASEELQPLCYEQKVGLCDALIHTELRVILIEIGGPVDYSHLPESLQYLKRTQGALRWRPRSGARLGLSLGSERSFWNRLRYLMPPVPSPRAMSKSRYAARCRHGDKEGTGTERDQSKSRRSPSLVPCSSAAGLSMSPRPTIDSSDGRTRFSY